MCQRMRLRVRKTTLNLVEGWFYFWQFLKSGIPIVKNYLVPELVKGLAKFSGVFQRSQSRI